MTLSELRYVVAVARERHFGRAAETCFVSQPTLSVAVKKLEEELGVVIFERGKSEVTLTPVGEQIVEQARRVLEEASALKELARQGMDPFSSPLRLGVIYTIGPYLLPQLVPALHAQAPGLPLHLQENFTARLAELLRKGEIDAAILALPFDEPGIAVQPLYDEPFVAAVPANHPWAARETVSTGELTQQKVLMLGSGHCFRDQVLEACPMLERARSANGMQHQILEGSSLETIRHMVASGVGITVLPCSSLDSPGAQNGLLRYIPFADPVPQRTVALAWRQRFPRPQVIDAVRRAVLDCSLACVRRIDS